MVRSLRMSVLCAVALVAACEVAHAQETPAPVAGDAALAPPYTLEVETDAPDVVSYDALAARVASELGGAVARPPTMAGRAAISVRYRSADHTLTVRATHVGGRVLERSVKADGDPAAIQREAVLLSGNLARDEARELLDAMAARKASEPPPKLAPKKPDAKKPMPDQGYMIANLSLFYPVATNVGRPHVRTSFDLSLLGGHVGKVEGLQVGSLLTMTSYDMSGLQVAAAFGSAGGHVSGIQIAGAGTLASEGVDGAQVGGAVNISGGPVEGAQIGPVNIASEGVAGAQIGVIGVAAKKVEGAQIGVVHVAGDVDGAQIGVINVGKKVNGAQIGVVNIAEEADVAIGVVSISKKAIHPIAWASNLAFVNAGVKFSSKYVYTSAAVSLGTVEQRGFGDGLGTIFALGTHVPVYQGFDLDVEGAFASINSFDAPSSSDNNLWIHGRILPGYTFADHLRVFAGGGIRAPLVVDVGREVIRPEFMAGVQF